MILPVEPITVGELLDKLTDIPDGLTWKEFRSLPVYLSIDPGEYFGAHPLGVECINIVQDDDTEVPCLCISYDEIDMEEEEEDELLN